MRVPRPTYLVWGGRGKLMQQRQWAMCGRGMGAGVLARASRRQLLGRNALHTFRHQAQHANTPRPLQLCGPVRHTGPTCAHASTALRSSHAAPHMDWPSTELEILQPLSTAAQAQPGQGRVSGAVGSRAKALPISTPRTATNNLTAGKPQRQQDSPAQPSQGGLTAAVAHNHSVQLHIVHDGGGQEGGAPRAHVVDLGHGQGREGGAR